MFNKPTVFIVGAGASAECGLPTGSQLKDRIRGGLGFQFEGGQLRKGDEALLHLLRGRFSQVNPYIKAGHELSATITTFPSIDEALHWWRARPEIVELGETGDCALHFGRRTSKSPRWKAALSRYRGSQ